MSRPTTSRWTYAHLKPRFGEDVKLIRIPQTDLGLRVPCEATLGGIVVVEAPEEEPRAVGVYLSLRLEHHGYTVREQALSVVELDDLDEHQPELVAMGVGATWDIDSKLNLGIRWAEMRKRVADEVELVVISDNGKLTTASLDDPARTDAERAAVLWWQASLVDGDHNVMISERFEITNNAAKQRIKRIREAGLIPAAHQGQRKVRT